MTTKPEDGDFCPRCGSDLLRGKDLIQEPRFEGLWVCDNMDCNYTRPIAEDGLLMEIDKGLEDLQVIFKRLKQRDNAAEGR